MYYTESTWRTQTAQFIIQALKELQNLEPFVIFFWLVMIN